MHVLKYPNGDTIDAWLQSSAVKWRVAVSVMFIVVSAVCQQQVKAFKLFVNPVVRPAKRRLAIAIFDFDFIAIM